MKLLTIIIMITSTLAVAKSYDPNSRTFMGFGKANYAPEVVSAPKVTSDPIVTKKNNKFNDVDAPKTICSNRELWLCVSASVESSDIGMQLNKDLSVSCGVNKVLGSDKTKSCVRVY